MLLARGRAANVEYRDYTRCLPAYLTALADAARAKRDAAIAQLTTPAAIGARQTWARETFWRLIGGEPERTPLRVQTTGSFTRDGYRVEKLVYESQPGLIIPANLYLPLTGKPPYPGVLFQMGHSVNGKAAVPYQKCCQGLARLGYIVLAFDPMGQGERGYYGSKLSPDDQHTVPGRQMLLVGDTASRMQTWDAVRSLDVLAAHPLVDPKRLATTGQSGGGTLAMMLAAVDDRLAAAAIASGNTENFACPNFNPPGSTDDAEQDFIASGPAGFDRWDLLYPIAPKPLLVLASARDFFGTYSSNYIANGRAEFARLSRVYETLGHQDRIAWNETPLPHGLSYALRLDIYNWFERWLRGSERRIAEEPAVEPERDEILWAGKTGNVAHDFNSTTPRQLVVAKVKTLRRGPVSKNGIAELLHLELAASSPARVLGSVPSERCQMEGIEIASAPNVFVPAWLTRPRTPKPDAPVLILLDPRGRARGVGEGGLFSKLAAAGAIVCAPDLRGIGDAAPEFGRGNVHYARAHAEDEHYAWASLILGRPLAGQRVTDLIAVVEAMHRQYPGSRVVVAASGKLATPAVFAAALDERISATHVSGGFKSYEDLLRTDESSEATANYIPGILTRTDLRFVIENAAPRPVIFQVGDIWNFDALSKL
jgi:dienelactone hydrolase